MSGGADRCPSEHFDRLRLSDTSNEISEPAKRVIEAMMTAPNEELFNPDCITNIGLEAEFSPEDSDKSAEAWDEMEGNWEKEVGTALQKANWMNFLQRAPEHSGWETPMYPIQKFLWEK